MDDDNLHARVSVLEATTKSHKEEIKASESRSNKKIEEVDGKLSATNKTLLGLASVVLVGVITQVLKSIGIN